jgi:regulator of PEP synthase PpsR (kinase-PPPase family)
MNRFHLHLISDSTGETLDAVAKAALAQFKEAEPVKHLWPMVRNARQMEQVLEKIAEKPGLVMFTLVNEDLREILLRGCAQLNIPFIPVMDAVMIALGKFLGAKADAKPGRQHELNQEYFERIEAMHYTMAHDDGQAPKNLTQADVILLGVSRTSKTPTCIYLANRGIKAANIPVVPNCPLPAELFNIKDKLIVGLFTSPERLVQIRKNRLLSMKEKTDTSYVNLDIVTAEVQAARRLYTENGWPVIDVTRRSIEETAAAIINLMNERRESIR